MKNTVILWILVLVSGYLNAQNTVSGRITYGNNFPLQGASILIPELNKGAISDSAGNFELKNLPVGKTRIQFSFLGFATVIKEIGSGGKPVYLDIVMHPSPIETEAIVVSGGYNVPQHDNAIKIDLLKLNPEEIKATPNFMEKVARIPGVEMISKGSGVSKPVIRGLSMNDVLVLNNGVRVENYQYSSHHPLGIDEFGIESVEVIKGPASLVYGSDAIGGVMNFIKENPSPVGTVSGDYNFHFFSGSQGIASNFGIKGSSKNFFGGVRFGLKSNADYLQGGGDYVPNSRFNEYSLKTQTGVTGKKGTLRLFYDYSRQNLGLVEEEAVSLISERGRKNSVFFQQITSHILSSQNKLYAGKWRFDINPAIQSTELIHVGNENETEIQMRLTTLTYETRIHLPAKGQGEYIAGFQGMNQWNNNLNNRETLLLPDAATENYSAFFMVQENIFKKITLQGGLRYDFNRIHTQPAGDATTAGFRPSVTQRYGSLNASGGATCRITESLLLRANLASAYRTPNLAELTSNGPHESRYEIGDANLEPEQSWEGDINLHYHVKNITFDVAAFYNHLNHYIYISPSSETSESGLPVYRYNQNNAILKGGEAGMHIHPRSMEWLHYETSFSMVTGVQQDGRYLPFIPAHKWNNEIRLSKTKLALFRDAYIMTSTSYVMKQSKTASDETQTPGYWLIDSGAGANLKIGRQVVFLALGVNNLLDNKYVDHLSTLKEVNYFNPGRSVTLSLNVPFRVETVRKPGG